MKNRLIGYTDIETLYQEKLRKEEAIWDELRETLYQKYLQQGYYMAWAREKARQDVLELRSMPKNVCTMKIPPEQCKQGDLD